MKEGLKKICSISSKNPIARFLQDVLVLCLLAGLLLYGTFTDHPVAPMIYQCYAIAFWQGWSGFQMSPGLSGQCSFLLNPNKALMAVSQHGLLHAMQQWGLPSGLVQFVAAQSPKMPYHALPNEYPFLSLLPFYLGSLASPDWYRAAFALWMVFFAGWIYVVLQSQRSRWAALAYSLYLVVGGWMTLAGRFDIVPATLTLLAVIDAKEKYWNWAFALLALATLSKLYPAILLIPFFLALQQETPGKWYAWRRWLPIGVFVGVCALVIGVSLWLSVAGTLAPLAYFIARPVESESLPGSLLWIASLLWKTPLAYVDSFGSHDIFSPWSPIVALLMNMMLVVGLFSTWRLQWRGRIDLAMACLLTLLIIMVTAKVFSIQYLIWVIPLAAYVGQSNRWWLLFWTLIGLLNSWRLTVLLTSWIFPSITFLYTTPLPYTIRNFLLLGYILSTLISRSLLSHPHFLPALPPGPAQTYY